VFKSGFLEASGEQIAQPDDWNQRVEQAKSIVFRSTAERAETIERFLQIPPLRRILSAHGGTGGTLPSADGFMLMEETLAACPAQSATRLVVETCRQGVADPAHLRFPRGLVADLQARIRHEYKSGSAVELRFYAVRDYKGELENRIFKDMRWAKPSELPSLDFLEDALFGHLLLQDLERLIDGISYFDFERAAEQCLQADLLQTEQSGTSDVAGRRD